MNVTIKSYSKIYRYLSITGENLNNDNMDCFDEYSLHITPKQAETAEQIGSGKWQIIINENGKAVLKMLKSK